MKYWLYTDSYPEDDDWEDWGIFEFKYYEDPEDENGIISAEITDIVINNSQMKIDNYDEIYDDAITNNPKRILAFLFDQKFYV